MQDNKRGGYLRARLAVGAGGRIRDELIGSPNQGDKGGEIQERGLVDQDE